MELSLSLSLCLRAKRPGARFLTREKKKNNVGTPVDEFTRVVIRRVIVWRKAMF